MIYLRFRKACMAQNITDLPYQSWLQPWGTYVQMVGFTFLCLINGFNVFWPQLWSASSFLTAYIGIPIFLAIYFGHRVYAREDPWAHDPLEVDMHTGMEEVLADGVVPKEKDGKIWMRVKVLWE